MKYQVQVTGDGVEWYAITKPVGNRNTALALAAHFNLENTGYRYRAFNNYTNREAGLN